MVRTRLARCALLLAGAATVASCSTTASSIAEQALAGDSKGYVSGDGTIEQIAPSARGAHIALRGQTVTGGSWDQSREGANRVVVINVWGQWCAPCVAETDHLQAAWRASQEKGQDVAFVGVNLRDSPATAAAFLGSHGVTYPSISDQASGGQPSLALAGKAPATPTTLVLDRQGRVAARVLGQTTQSSLLALVDAVLLDSGTTGQK